MDMPADVAASVLKELPRLARLVKQATGADGVNIVQNSGNPDPNQGSCCSSCHRWWSDGTRSRTTTRACCRCSSASPRLRRRPARWTRRDGCITTTTTRTSAHASILAIHLVPTHPCTPPHPSPPAWASSPTRRPDWLPSYHATQALGVGFQ
eukprot:scaffold4155_cov70-Phaeocystis_antarctica.AAC.2